MYKRVGSLNCSPRSSGRKLIRGHFSGAACILPFLTIHIMRYTWQQYISNSIHYAVYLTAVYIYKLIILKKHYTLYKKHCTLYIIRYIPTKYISVAAVAARSNPHPCGHAYPRLFKLQFSCSIRIEQLFNILYLKIPAKGVQSLLKT